MTAALLQWYAPETGTSFTSTRIYRSDTGETGTYNLIATVSGLTTTSYFDESSSATSWYKISFYDSVNAYEGPLSTAFYVSATATMYTNPSELRKFMQFAVADFPNDEDVTLLLEQAHVQLGDDVIGYIGSTISIPKKLKLLALFLGASFVCRSLASRALSKGYISISMEGVNIMKAHDAFMRMADYYYEKYQEQLAKDTVDYAATSYLPNVVSTDTITDLKDMMNGVSDGLDLQSNYTPSFNSKNRTFGN